MTNAQRNYLNYHLAKYREQETASPEQAAVTRAMLVDYCKEREIILQGLVDATGNQKPTTLYIGEKMLKVSKVSNGVEKDERQCQQCGSSIAHKPVTARFCSSYCRTKKHRSNL